MNRLTHRDIAIQLDKDVESTITISENVSRDIYLKCSYLEDFLEEHDCETLSDYTKQVRKEVCEEIKEQICMLAYKSNTDENFMFNDNVKFNKVLAILDQIQD